jgi:hypothetical protein
MCGKAQGENETERGVKSQHKEAFLVYMEGSMQREKEREKEVSIISEEALNSDQII